jgi:NADH-dependent peroxiredoxin subunit C
MFNIDKPFPNYSLDSYLPKSDDIKIVASDELKGSWVMLFFYPADFTFVCPTELADLSKSQQAFSDLGCKIVSVSTDTVFSHKGWVEAEKLLQSLDFPMAADHNGALSRELGILDEANGMVTRAAFIIDPDGILKAVDIVADSIGRSANELLRKLKALKFTREHPHTACPASWNDNGPVLNPSIKISGKVFEELNK